MLVVVTLLSVTLMTFDQRGGGSGLVGRLRSGAHDALAPVEDGASAVISSIGDFFGGIAHYGDLKAENERLRKQLADQRGVVESSANLERQYRDLLDLENLTYLGGISSVAARVVSGSPTNFESTLGIDKGTDDGIAVGLPVVAGDGLIGRISSASAHRATVLLLVDPDFNVGVRMSDSRDVGAARGRGPGAPLRVDFIDPKTKVSVGETVVTSGLQQSLFPADIPVGRVRSVASPAGALQQDITVTPFVDLGRLSFVRVLLWSPS